MSHLEARLEKDLNRIRSLVEEQANHVEESVRNAIHALQTGNRKLAYANILADHPINRRMRQIDRLCHSFIAVHLPSAGHLRLMSAAIRINIELERIGDYAVTISREAVQVSATPSGVMARELERMAGETLLMLRQALKGFHDLNAEMARSTMVIADQIESDMDLIYGELMTNSRATGDQGPAGPVRGLQSAQAGGRPGQEHLRRDGVRGDRRTEGTQGLQHPVHRRRQQLPEPDGRGHRQQPVPRERAATAAPGAIRRNSWTRPWSASSRSAG